VSQRGRNFRIVYLLRLLERHASDFITRLNVDADDPLTK
jgi:hypothetical protein